MKEEHCEQCARPTAAWDAIHYGSAERGSRLLCSQCFNAEVARQNGLANFENVRLEPVRMVDCAGEEHQFHFQMRLLGDMSVLDAFELRDELRSGYEFRIIGAPEDEVLTLLGRLIGKIRRALSVKHLTVDNDQPRIVGQTVRGQISSDMSGVEDVPLVVVDGKEIAWEDFGRMLLGFEGWQFRFDIADRADEL